VSSCVKRRRVEVRYCFLRSCLLQDVGRARRRTLGGLRVLSMGGLQALLAGAALQKAAPGVATRASCVGRVACAGSCKASSLSRCRMWPAS
jgi:hypothetical protein